jgi:FKBP-type peptidyl-prolyl cis-trans isomerase FklB
MTFRLKVLSLFTIGVMGLCTAVQAASEIKTQADLKDTKSKLGYIMGHDIGSNLSRFEAEINIDALIKGIRDGMAKAEALIPKPEAEALMRQEFGRITQEMQAKNLKEGQAYLEKHKKEKGVQTTASGLQYKILQPGTGKKPKATDRVKVHYRGTFIDGTEFDSSYARSQPAVFEVGRLISGWSEGLQLLSEGSKARLVLPPELGYGERGAGDQIGPNTVLIFEMELLEILGPEEQE